MSEPRPRRRGFHIHSLYEGIADAELSYEERVDRWRSGLDNTVVRALAEDYRRGARDEATLDGYKEFKRRWPTAVKVYTTRGVDFKLLDGYDPTGARCLRHKSGRRPGYCADCASIQMGSHDSGDQHSTNSIDQPGEAIQDEPDVLPGARFDLIEQLDHPMIPS